MSRKKIMLVLLLPVVVGLCGCFGTIPLSVSGAQYSPEAGDPVTAYAIGTRLTPDDTQRFGLESRVAFLEGGDHGTNTLFGLGGLVSLYEPLYAFGGASIPLGGAGDFMKFDVGGGLDIRLAGLDVSFLRVFAEAGYARFASTSGEDGAGTIDAPFFRGGVSVAVDLLDQ